MPADDRVNLDRHIILGLNSLTRNSGELNLDVFVMSYGRCGVDLPTMLICSEQTLTLTRPGSTDL